MTADAAFAALGEIAAQSKPRARFLTGIVLTAACLACGSAWAGPAISGPISDLAPHKAVYQMRLATTKLSGGVTGAYGQMVYKFADSCDGWTVENQTQLTFAYNDGAPVATTWNFLTWESKDGLKYRFRVRSTRDGVVSEEIDGTAHLDPQSHAGQVKYTLPEPKTMALPRGTLFPTEHTIRLLDLAQKGSKLIDRTLFDGTGLDGPSAVNAVVSSQLPANSPSNSVGDNAEVNPTLLTAQSWRMQMAFFNQNGDGTPDYEVALRYYLNGVADEVVQSFGSFTLKGTLQSLQPLPKPDC